MMSPVSCDLLESILSKKLCRANDSCRDMLEKWGGGLKSLLGFLSTQHSVISAQRTWYASSSFVVDDNTYDTDSGGASFPAVSCVTESTTLMIDALQLREWATQYESKTNKIISTHTNHSGGRYNRFPISFIQSCHGVSYAFSNLQFEFVKYLIIATLREQ